MSFASPKTPTSKKQGQHRLGAANFNSSDDFEFVGASPPRRRYSLFKATIFLLVTVVVIGIVMAVVLAVKEASAPSLSNSGNSTTPTPTASVGTLRPTRSPTAFPTNAPTNTVTESPSLSPTSAPTNSPVEICLSDDAVCGCSQIRSKAIDVVFLVDESGSVTQDNYDLMIGAIKNFSLDADPAMNLENGTRIGYVEFNNEASGTIELADFDNAEDFNAALETFTYDGGATNHKAAFERARDMLREEKNSLREGSQLAIVMLTDGKPCVLCVDSGTCCPNSFALGSGGDILREIRDEREFTFYLLPIQPPSGQTVALTTFNDAIGEHDGSTGLTFDEIVIFDVQGFEDLNQFLTGDNFTFPLGPCVIPPSVSTEDRALLALDADDEWRGSAIETEEQRAGVPQESRPASGSWLMF